MAACAFSIYSVHNVHNIYYFLILLYTLYQPEIMLYSTLSLLTPFMLIRAFIESVTAVFCYKFFIPFSAVKGDPLRVTFECSAASDFLLSGVFVIRAYHFCVQPLILPIFCRHHITSFCFESGAQSCKPDKRVRTRSRIPELRCRVLS